MTTHSLLPLVACLGLAACSLFEGPAGPAGDAGPQGQAGTACWDLNGNGQGDLDSEDLNGDGAVDLYDCRGPAGEADDGEDGEDWAPPDMVGAEACADCHPEQYEAWRRSGMANAMQATGGLEPSEAWAELGEFGEFSEEPPAGYDWSEIRYVFGGWSRLQAFVDDEGWVITGASSAWAQQHEAWIDFEDGFAPGTLATDCGSCHATGYRPEGHQDQLEGVTGTWQAEGVGCERCHGNGSQHSGDPWAIPMTVDRAAELCGECHTRDSTASIQAHDGFLLDGQQWSELFHGKKHVMDCIDCHDPHRSAHHPDSEHNPDAGLRVACESCHFVEAAQQGSEIMAAYAGCTGCHMPDAVVTAQAFHSAQGDHPAHLFAINLDPDAAQVSGDSANPWVSLDFACRSCHSEAGGWTIYSEAELLEEATGYHGG